MMPVGSPPRRMRSRFWNGTCDRPGIAEGLQVESEQFARLAGGDDLGDGLTAWIERRQLRTI
jgi:hypothetical protein